MKAKIFKCLATLAGLLLSYVPAFAQQSLQVLHGHVSTAVSSGKAELVGSLPSEKQLNLTVVLPLRNQSELTSLLSRLYDPSSPDYRHFLSVGQFTDQFGPTVADYQAVVDFAKANGFSVNDTPANRLIVPISGSAAQIEKAFHVQMKVYQHPTESRTFFSPDREPSVNLSVPLLHIVGLNNFSIPHPMVRRAAAGQVTGNTTGSGPGGSYLGSDMRAAYYGNTILTGAGQAVGLLEFGGYNLSDVNLTFSSAGQSYNVPINNVLLDGATAAPVDGDVEQVLDIVQAIGMAPGLSQVRVYIGNYSEVDIFNAMATENICKQLSTSWGWAPDDPSTDDVFFQEFAAQGQSLFTYSGDDGAFDTATSQAFYPAEDDYVTAVGATHLNTNGAGGSWASESAWNSEEPGTTERYGSGGGISPDGIPIPSWQAGAANSANGASTTLRNVPDVAMEGDFDNYNCEMGSCRENWAGTSFAAPRWAGFMALINQQAVEAGTAPRGGLGFINPAIYSIGAGSSFNSDFHDIVSGNNDTYNQPVWYSAVPGYDLVTGWGSPAGQHLIDALAGPQVPGFWLSTTPSILSINQGASGTTTVTMTDASGFAGSANLAVSGLPSGVNSSWSTNPTSGTSVLTLTASSSAAAGTSTVTITGTSGSLNATTSLPLTVQSPNFTLSASSSILTVNQGNSSTSTILVNPEYGFTGSVNLTVSGLPSGMTSSWSTNPTTGTSVLTLTASSSAVLGTSAVTIIGNSGALSASTTITVTVRTVAVATATTLTATAAGAPASSVASGSVVILTATVSAGPTVLTTGQVNFCDATAAHCEDIHLLGTAQLTSTGTAVLKFVPGIGSHSYKAVFVGSATNAASNSNASALTVTSAIASTTTIAQSGNPGDYTLTAIVTGQGAVSPTGTISFLDTSNANVLLGTAALVGEEASVNWLTSQSPAAGSSPMSIAVGDFSGDGIPDLAVANLGGTDGSVTILLGNGDGTFAPTAVSPSTGTYSWSIAVGDFNGDGKTDLAVANAVSDTVTILLGKGDGTFTPQAVSPVTGSYPESVAVGDFNGDGIPDLAVANGYGNSITILLGNGDGTFTPAASPTTDDSPVSVAVGDFNGDGIRDLAVANAGSGTVTVLLGNGDGTFTSTASPAAGWNPVSVAIGDFNGDGIPDLAVANEYGNTVTVLLGKGDGTFTPAPSPATGNDPSSVTVGDFNGDGNADLAVANSKDNTVTILLGNGNGTFTAAANPSTGNYPLSVAVGNFKKDGQTGLAVANNISSTTTVLTTQLTQTATAVASNISVGAGTHLVEASYPGDNNYTSSVSGTTALTAPLVTPTVLVTPSSTSITTAQPLTVMVAINGTPTPTGLVKLVSGSDSNTQTLSGGSTTFTIAAGSLAAGSDTFTANYTPDSTSASIYNSATGTSPQITVTTAVPPSFTVSGTTVSVAPGVTTGNTSTITVTPLGGFTGMVSLSCAITPMTARDAATCSIPSSVTIGGTTPQTITLTVHTTAATSATQVYPKRQGAPWYPAGGTTLAGLLVFGITVRRRNWQTRLGMLLFFAILVGGLSACGGGGGVNSGTTPGTYTVTVTGTSGTLSQQGAITLTVQ
ncbi:FG-GAP-like repeat-containing protein [Granulicella sp. S156]|uniref:FG-GAP-like repeat-containing protein n=1 Tax=Granulicella sp. S156 TaxID=1747224 RepID=UPI00131E327D|nr:FG-GAP-like repeat-containing protein [Granulicella sp. S156]